MVYDVCPLLSAVPQITIKEIARHFVRGHVKTTQFDAVAQRRNPSQRKATILLPMNPVRLSPTKHAPVLGLVFGGMQFPVTARAENCEFLRVTTPWWGEAWIIGPPEFATLDGAGCADLPDLSLGRQPKG